MSTPIPSQDGTVNYTVKELVGRIDVKIDGLYDKLDTKVDQTDFVAMKTEVKRDLDDLKAARSMGRGAIAVVALLATAGLFHPFS